MKRKRRILLGKIASQDKFQQLVIQNWQFESDYFYIPLKDQQKYKLMGFLLRLGFFFLLVVWAQTQCCLQFEGKACIRCPSGLHLYRGNCLINIENCAQYKDGFDCQTCTPGHKLNVANGECDLVPPTPPPAPEYKDSLININDAFDPHADYFMLSNDYFISLYLLNESPKVNAARAREYKNGTILITIEYQGKSGKFYEGVIQPNLLTFIFSEKSFREIPKPTLIKLPITTVFDIKKIQHSNMVKSLQLVLKLQNKNINQIVSGKITSNPDDTVTAIFLYSGVTAGDQFEVTATYDQTSSLKNFNVIQTKQAPVVTIKEDPQKITTNQKNNAPSNLSYKQFDPQTSKDPFYGITKDFIGAQNSRYKGLHPTKAEQSDVNTIKYFRFEFTLPDQAKWQVLANIDTKTFIISVEKQTLLSNIPNPTQAPFAPILVGDAYKDFNFLFVLAEIEKQTNGKYKGIKASRVEKQSNEDGTTKYRILFQKEGFEWNLEGKINGKLVISEFKETKGQQIKSEVTGGEGEKNSSQTENKVNSDGATKTETNIPPQTKPTETTQNQNIQNSQTPSTNQTTETNQTIKANQNKTNPSPPKQQPPTPSAKEVALPGSVLSMTIGLEKLSKEDEKGPEFTQIKDLLQQVTPELENAVLLGGFFSMQSFTRNYQIYYRMASGQIYEARVARDLLRKRTYIISFGRISF